jgi:AhpD family alkylhydroperoxidase
MQLSGVNHPQAARDDQTEIRYGKEVIMEPRIDFMSAGQGAMKAMLELGNHIHKSGLDNKLIDFVNLRVSQINGCAYCIDMHWKDLRAAGETEQRLYGLDAWRESPYYNDKERAALAWAEAVTQLGEGRVPDEVFEETKRHFSDRELADLTLAVVAINGWNRLNIAFRTTPGTYQPGMFQKRQIARAS